jgi:hypothetical protein
MIFKAASGQGIYLFAIDSNGDGKAGDAANITATLSKDGGTSPVATATANPAEVGRGIYWLPLSQSETSCNAGAIVAVSSTPGVTLDPVIFYTQGGAIPFVAAGSSGGLPTADASNGVKVSVGTGTGQINAASGKVPATLAAADVSGNIPANVTELNGSAANATTGAIDSNLVSVNGAVFSGAKVPSTVAPGDDADAVAIKVVTDQLGTTLVSGAGGNYVFTAASLANAPMGPGEVGTGTDPWSVTLPGSYATGTAGAILGSTLPAVKAKTDNLPAGFPGNFSSLGITAAGKIAGVALCDTVTTYIGNIPQSGDLYAVVNPMVNARVFTGQALSNAPTGSGTAGVSLSQVQGELDARGLTATTTTLVATNLDAKVSTRSTYAGGIVAGVSSPVTVGTNNDKAGYALAAAGLDAIQVESGVNARQALSPILAASAGAVAGAGTGTIVIKGGNTSTTRIVASTDNAGNRSSVVLTLPN